MQGPVIYLTGEGVSGFKRRLVAMRRHHGIEGQGVPFFMIENLPDLGSTTTDLPQLLAELDAFIARTCPGGPRAIVLDTLARCMGEGDESTARDMGRFVDRCATIERHFECLVAVVHHVGKDPGRGGRGSNAQNGAADVTLLVEKLETYSKVRIEEMKDGRENQEWSFRLAPYDLGPTSATSATFSGSCAPLPQLVENTTCVVEILSEPSKAQPRATKNSKPPSGVAGGTWVHPQVAINLGQWVSAPFAVQVSQWVYDWMSGQSRSADIEVPYHLRRYVANFQNVPVGHFSMLTEILRH